MRRCWAVYRIPGGRQGELRLKTPCLPWDRTLWGALGDNLEVVAEGLAIWEAEQLQSNCTFDEQWEGMVQQALERSQTAAWRRFYRQALENLAGRVLLEEEVKRALMELGQTEEIWPFIQALALLGKVRVAAAVEVEDEVQRKGQCRRCGEREAIYFHTCARCGGRCASCEACLQMGTSCRCAVLVTGIALQQSSGWDGIRTREAWRNGWEERTVVELTQRQRRAAGAARQLLRTPSVSRLLIWAVCGAGKTEVCFPAVDDVLQSGGHVLWATPRRDVVLELVPRLRAAFPGASLAAFYGGSPESWGGQQLVVATTHQTLRFYRFFDLVVVDEVDAFPFHRNDMLHRSVARAVRNGGKTVYLTATPPSQLIQGIRKGELSVALIPSRFHGFPLPLPRLLAISALRHRRFLPREVLLLTEQVNVAIGERMLIFVPRIKDVESVVDALQRGRGSGERQGKSDVEGTHASDPLREEKVGRFRRGEVPFLVTTTILERGVTLERCHVLVLYASDPLFDQAALVQMAGRAGRAAVSPHDPVYFLGEDVSPAMKAARHFIQAMNRSSQQEAAEEPFGRNDDADFSEGMEADAKFFLWQMRKWGQERSRRLEPLVSLLYPERGNCPICGGFISLRRRGYARFPQLCQACAGELPWILPDGRRKGRPICLHCGRIWVEEGGRLCGDCLGDKGLAMNRGVFRFEGILQHLLYEWKYRGRRSLGSLMGELLLEGYLQFEKDYAQFPRPDVIVPVPLHENRLLERGFNQSQELAEAIGSLLGLPAMPLLTRVRDTDKQSRLSKSQRKASLRGAFAIRQGEEKRHGEWALLVDDVYTTGSTLEAASEVLKEAGVAGVLSLTLAR